MIEVYGASDDLIEVEGEIREEFSYDDSHDRMILGFSDGTLLSIEYDQDGIWRIYPLAASTVINIKHAPVNDDSNYSDRARFEAEGKIEWVVCGSDYSAVPVTA